MHKFILLIKKMFLAKSQSKLYALQYREQIERLKSQDEEPVRGHPIRRVLNFIGKSAFFEEGTSTVDVTAVHLFPDKLELSATQVIKFISTLKWEKRAEVDLLEVFTKILADSERLELDKVQTSDALIDLLQTVVSLIEQDFAYPEKLLDLLCQYAFRQLIQIADQLSDAQITKIRSIVNTPCFRRKICMDTDECHLISNL